MEEFEGVVPILNVNSFAAAVDYYVNKLGFRKAWAWGEPECFGGIVRGKVEIFLCEGGQGQPGTWMSVFMKDVRPLFEEYRKSGAMIVNPPTNYPWGVCEMLVEDLDGHRLRMGGERTGPDDEIVEADDDRFRAVPKAKLEADLKALTAANEMYIRCVVHADADQFAAILAEDFLCSNPDGSLLNKDEFLQRVRAGRPLKFMDTHDVRIRVLQNVAIIHAGTTFATRDGVRGAGRYTDSWARRGGRWLAISAHVTRNSQ